MALGKPVIASRATGNAVIIRDGVDGLLVAPEDPSDWAAPLNSLLSDQTLAARLGRAARLRARVDFALERTVTTTLAVYREVLDSFPVPRSPLGSSNLPTRNAERGTRNVLLLTYDFPPCPGGIARAMGEIARHATPEVVVSTGRTSGDIAWDRASNVRVMRTAVDSERLRTVGGLVRWAGRLINWCAPTRPTSSGPGTSSRPGTWPAGWAAPRHSLRPDRARAGPGNSLGAGGAVAPQTGRRTIDPGGRLGNRHQLQLDRGPLSPVASRARHRIPPRSHLGHPARRRSGPIQSGRPTDTIWGPGSGSLPSPGWSPTRASTRPSKPWLDSRRSVQICVTQSPARGPTAIGSPAWPTDSVLPIAFASSARLKRPICHRSTGRPLSTSGSRGRKAKKSRGLASHWSRPRPAVWRWSGRGAGVSPSR